jgi:hypothetical protein
MSSSSLWFKNLFGLKEASYRRTRENFALLRHDSGEFMLRSHANNKEFPIGRFSTPSLAELRAAAVSPASDSRATSFEHRVVTDILKAHSENPGAVFQAASQFNCLEFPNPGVTPGSGVTDYASDPTQGPACALACAAGTVYRNYFAPVHIPGTEDTLGQTSERQINNLWELEEILENSREKYWAVRNGYTFSDRDSLQKLNDILSSSTWNSEEKRDELLQHVRIGVHDNVGVTFAERYVPLDPTRLDIRVTQCYCSALSCAYSGVSNHLWENLARIVLDASYEATIWAAASNHAHHSTASSAASASPSSSASASPASASASVPTRMGSRDVFLTFLGGGVFGNAPEWIADAIGRAIAISKHHNLDINIIICHYRKINQEMVQLVDRALQREMLRLQRK